MGAPAYGQTKFNVINYSIVHSTSTSVPPIPCGVLALLTIVLGVAGPVVNALPRFLLAGLLVYSGAGFLVGGGRWGEDKREHAARRAAASCSAPASGSTAPLVTGGVGVAEKASGDRIVCGNASLLPVRVNPDPPKSSAESGTTALTPAGGGGGGGGGLGGGGGGGDF